MKTFQIEMKQRQRISREVVEKYKDTICFMVETDSTCFEVVEPRVKRCPPMGYEVSAKLIIPYVEYILTAEKDPNEERWGTYEEKSHKVREELTRGTRKRKVAKTSSDKPSEVLKRLREMVEGIASSQAGSKQEPPKATKVIKAPTKDVASKVATPILAKETSQETALVQTRRRSERAPIRKSRKVATKTTTIESSQATKSTEKVAIEEKKEEKEAKQAEAPMKVLWKPDMRMLAKRMLEKGKINQLNRFFDRYKADDKILIEDLVIEYMIKYKNNLIELEGSIPQDLYDRLEVRKLRAIEEDQ